MTDSATQLKQPANSRPSIVRASAAVATALILSVALTAVVATSSSERFAGTLMTDSQKVSAPAEGRIDSVLVSAGDIVLPDREMFLIIDEEMEQRVESARVEVGRLTSRLAAAESDARIRAEQRLAVIESHIFDTELEMADFLRRQFQHKFEVAAWSEYLDPVDSLASNGTPPINLESAILRRNTDSGEARIRAIISRANSENEVESLDAKILLCEHRLDGLKKRQDSIVQSSEALLGVVELRHQLEQAQQTLDEAEAELEEHIVEAPSYGMAGIITHRVGQKVRKGDVLVELFDRDAEFVLVEFPSRHAPQLRKGTRVELTFPGEEHREGEISDVPPEVTSLGKNQVESRIAVRISPVGRAWPALPVGSTVYTSFQ